MVSLLPKAPRIGTATPAPILLLPDELLLEIFAGVKYYKPINKSAHQDFASSSADIAAARLVCRRFAALSSHLLVHYIRLDGINTNSLERLESISHHPLIRQGVRIVRFEAISYVQSLADGVVRFARWAAGGLLQKTISHRQAFEDEINAANARGDDASEDLTRRRHEVVEALENAKAVLQT